MKDQKAFMFKDIWRNGFYTISSINGYETYPTKEEAQLRLRELQK